MGSFPKPKANNSNTNTTTHNNKAMGFLLVFFPEDNNNNTPTSTTIDTNKKRNIFSSSSLRKPTNSNNNPLLSKAQSTISICLLLLFTTFLLFTLSTFDKPTTPHHITLSKQYNALNDVVSPSTALQRMGTLYRKGTRAMNDIVVCHVTEDTTQNDFKFFLRLLHRSGLTSKSDVVFIFSSSSTTFSSIIRQENLSFNSLVTLHSEFNSTHWAKSPESSFDLTRFLKPAKKGDTLWGRKIPSSYNDSQGESTQLTYGSVLSFHASELDPENSLAGFLDRVPLSLRRWACYPMLLGRVRRNFKHVMLVDVKRVVIFRDPLGRVRNRSPDSVFVYPINEKRGKNSEKTQSHHLVNPAILMGGARGIRRVSNAMLVAIVRAAMQHKKRNSVSESAILSQLVRNEFALKNVDLVVSGESIPEASSLSGSTPLSDYLMVQRGNSDLNSIVKKQMCCSVTDSFVYSDCQQQQLETPEKTNRKI